MIPTSKETVIEYLKPVCSVDENGSLKKIKHMSYALHPDSPFGQKHGISIIVRPSSQQTVGRNEHLPAHAELYLCDAYIEENYLYPIKIHGEDEA